MPDNYEATTGDVNGNAPDQDINDADNMVPPAGSFFIGENGWKEDVDPIDAPQVVEKGKQDPLNVPSPADSIFIGGRGLEKDLDKDTHDDVLRALESRVFDSTERAKKIFGEDFYGKNEVEVALDIKIAPEQVPTIPFSEEELVRAQELNQRLILMVDKTADGEPITMKYLTDNIRALSGLGRPGFIAHEGFYNTEIPRARWVLV